MGGREIGGCTVACYLQTARPNGACAFVRYRGEGEGDLSPPTGGLLSRSFFHAARLCDLEEFVRLFAMSESI